MNTERSLRALFEAFVADPYDTHHGPNLVGSIFAYARRPRTVEAWEDGPCGVGMSDKAVREPFVTAPGGQEIIDRYRADRDAASRPPAAEEPSGRAAEAQDGRGGSDEPETTLGWKSHAATLNPAPIAPEPGERRPLPLYDCQGDGE